MGCFLACFGFKQKKKNLKPTNKSPSGEQNYGSYVPLDSHVSIKLDIQENITSDSYHLKEKPKESSKSKTRKKVSFNLNVKTYEPITNDDDTIDYLSEGEKETRWDYSNSIATTCYRYQNCRDNYDDDDDDDELEFDENDLSFGEFDEDSDHEPDDVFSNESDDGIPSQEHFPWESNPVASENEFINNRTTDEKNRSLEGLKPKIHVRDRRSRYVFSVLNPVENLTQWKKAKAKAETGQMKFQKENLNSKQEEESFIDARPNSDSLNFKKTRNSDVSQIPERAIAVDASFSNWNTKEV